MNSAELAGAFGLEDYVAPSGKELIERYGADSAVQGKFIRYKRFLNIPCPGTGSDGDPNISVKLDEEMKEAVHNILSPTKVMAH